MKMKILLVFVLAAAVLVVGCTAEHQVSLEANPEEGGNVEGAGTYEQNTAVTVQAEPFEGYVFAGWEEAGEIVSNEKSYQFEIEADKTLVALFEEEEAAYQEVDLYFGYTEAIQTGETGRYGYVSPYRAEVPDHDHPEKLLTVTLEALFEGPDPEEEDFSPVVRDPVQIIALEIDEGGLATLNLSEEMFGEQWPGGSLAGNVFIQSVLWTATQFAEVNEVMVLVEGEPWDDGHRIWDDPKAPEEEEAMLPGEIEEWIEYSRDIWLAQAREYEGALYLLVTFGEQPTGGYSVEITSLEEEADQLTVTVKFTEPGEDDIVTQALTYPYDLKETEPTGLPVEFVAEGDVEIVPALHNLDWLPPMVAGSEDIRVLSPAPGDTVPREFMVEGIELVFEGTVQYELTDGAGNELDSGFTTGHGYNWGHFTVDLSVPEEIESGEEIIVKLYSESPRDGSVENLVELDLVIE